MTFLTKYHIKITLLFLLFLQNFISYSQQTESIFSPINGTTVSFTEFIDAMVEGDKLIPKNGKTYELVIKNVRVQFVKNIDKGKNGMDERFGSKNPSPIYIKPNLRIANIDFDPEFWFVPRNLVFEGHVFFTSLQHFQGLFKECTFKKSLAFFSNQIEFIDFVDCRFENGFRLARCAVNDHLRFEKSTIDIKKNLVDGITKSNFGVETKSFFIDNKTQNLDLVLQDCKILVADSLRHKPQFFVSISSSVFSNIRLINNIIETSIDMENSAISNNFQLENTNFKGKLFIFGVNINPLGTRLDWNLVTKKLAVQDKKTKQNFSYNDKEIMPVGMFNELFSVYSVIYTAFKSQGNRYSTNLCYIEWKNLETKYLSKLQEQNKEFSIYFTYLMNVFLDAFCDYGTNPLKSLYISFYVMLCFAVLYFFLPHNFGHYNESFYKTLSGYLSQINSVTDIKNTLILSKTQYSRETKSVVEYINTLKTEKKAFYYYIVAIPDLVRHYISRIFMRFSFYLGLKITTFSENKRYLAEPVMFLVILWIVIKKLFVRTLDCVALSMNIFTTLGFGSTEMIGLPMYLTVIEGFIGWLLLSFFSLSLISQLIN